jgi:predicted transposase YbfD/YdcC
MDYTTWSIPSDSGMVPEAGAVTSLYEALRKLPDPRRRPGKRYELALILCLLILAKLAGQTSLSGATEWIRHRGASLAERFGLRRKNMPCQMTYCNVLARVDGKHLDEILSAFACRDGKRKADAETNQVAYTRERRQADHRHLAIDGKTLRATCSQPHPVHQLSCYEVATGIVLWHCTVEKKENEISALKPLLTPQVVKGRIFTLDAMHTQRMLCARVHRLAGDYILEASDNQPTLGEDIADLFEDRTPDRRRRIQAETWDKAHGRLEHRETHL